MSSFMGRFVGRKGAPPPPKPTLGEAGEKIDGRVEGLDKKIAELNKQLQGFRNQLKKARGSSKASLQRRAMQVLKRKRMYEKQRDQLAQQGFNLEQQDFTMQTLKDTATTVDAMKESAAAMKQQYKTINIDKIEDIQDDLADLMADAEEVQDVLGRAYGLPDDVDEADLEDELAALDDELEMEADAEGDEVPSYLQPSSIPAAPDAKPDVATAEGVDEFGLPTAVQN